MTVNGKVMAHQFFITGCNTAFAFDFLKELFDEKAVLVEVTVNVSRLERRTPRGNDDGTALFEKLRAEGLGIVAFVRDDIRPQTGFQQRGGLGDIVPIPLGEGKANGIT